jgi:LDH2 family malate/lactate/ureidoglycolate dehydrogenase
MSAAPGKPQKILVTSPALQAFVAALFGKAGMSAAHAATVAEALVWSNLRGVDTHGVSRAARYVEFIETGIINATPDMRVVTDTPAVQVLEADRAAGAIAMNAAADAAMAKAAAVGMGMVMVRGTTHTGSIGMYTERIARRGMTAIAACASIPNMAYHGARAAGVSTAPLSIAVPGAGDTPIVLDMSTGIVSLGRLVQAKRLKETLAPGLALDAQGQPTTDSQLATIPLPLGGAKGSGLSLMIEMLSSLAVGNPLLAEFFSGKPGTKRHRQNALIIAVDVFRFCPEAEFRADVARTVAALKALPADRELGGILMPGERGYAEAQRRGRDGIPIPPGVAGDLVTVAGKFGLNVPWSA